LGAYDSTPLEVAAAYTLFANGGNRVSPTLIDMVLSSEDEVLLKTENRPVPVLDARVAYLVLDLLVDNMNRGTGAGSRARGFTAPAAGKTGTSRDGWFVGFTSNLLCAVWVGFDDYRDLGLSGNAAALPIWTAFMKRAVQLPAYRNPQTFIPPEGMVAVPLDPETLQTATADCPEVRTELFILGTEPRDLCPKHRPSLVRRVTRSLSRVIGIRSRPRSQEPVPDAPPKPETGPPAPVRPQPQTPRSLGGNQN
jgi:penicillin-binding protein 1B